MKKGLKITLIVVAAVVLVAMGVAGYMIAYRFNHPEWSENAKSIAFDYIENNPELIEKYGQEFKYKMIEYDSEFGKKDGMGYFYAVFRIEQDKYEIKLECSDNVWSVVEFKMK